MIDWLTEAQIELKHYIAYVHQHNPRAARRIYAEIIRRVASLERFFKIRARWTATGVAGIGRYRHALHRDLRDFRRSH